MAPPTRRQDGFSIIEALIAAAILLVIALGLLPLFSRSISDNVSGNDATQATNGSRTRLEELMQVPFNNTQLVIPAGSTKLELKDSWTRGKADPSTHEVETGNPDEGWWTNPSGHGVVLWSRTARVQQYAIGDLSDGTLDKPLDGGTQPTFVQLKQVEVVVDNPKKNLLGNGQGITLRVVKPF
ncbi:MAG TPA: prepilin-type N-terminal cleavage/methylation domain-containing protein [Thermoanaerobaculia bacterium]|jgi:type II secretory pathway pseudopilin PulG